MFKPGDVVVSPGGFATVTETNSLVDGWIYIHYDNGVITYIGNRCLRLATHEELLGRSKNNV